MANRRVNRDSVFDISIAKYLVRKDVYLINQALIKKDPKELFAPNEDNIIREGDKVVIRIPIAQEQPEPENKTFFSFLEEYFMPQIDQEKIQEFWFYKNFYWAMMLRPNFYRYTIREINKINWVKEHRRDLAFLLLFDMLSEKAPAIYDSHKYIERIGDAIDERQGRLLRNEYYPDLFFRPADELVTRKRDKRVEHYSSIITDAPNFGIDYWQACSLMMTYNQMFNEHLPQGQEFEKLDYLSTCIRLVTADEIQDIITFGDELNLVLEKVITRVGPLDADQTLIVKEIQKKTEIIEEFRALLNTATYIRWFQTKTQKQRMEYLQKNRRLTYSEKEAEQIIPLLIEHYQDPEIVEAYLYFGAKAYEAYKKPKYADILYKARNRLKDRI